MPAIARPCRTVQRGNDIAKILVTGAAGQVGCRLVRQLLNLDYEVRATVLPDDPNASRVDDLDIEIAAVDLTDSQATDKAVAGCDGIIHCAVLINPLEGMSELEFFHNNVASVFNVAKAAAQRADSIERLVAVSTASVYPMDTQHATPAYHPVDELHPKRPVTIYALSKLVGEQIVEGLSRQTGLRFSIVRPSGILSEAHGVFILRCWTVWAVGNVLRDGQAHPDSELYMPDGSELWHELEETAESPDQPCAITDLEGSPWMTQMVDARDVAHGCICALRSPAAIGEAFNIAGPSAIAYTEAARLLSEVSGRPILE